MDGVAASMMKEILMWVNHISEAEIERAMIKRGDAGK